MTHRSGSAPRGSIRRQAAYSIAQLAAFTGLTRFVLRGLLDSYGVQFVRSGRKVLVPVTEIEDKIPLLWKNKWRLESARLTEGRAPPHEETSSRRGSSAPPPGFLAARRSVRAGPRGSRGVGRGSR